MPILEEFWKSHREISYQVGKCQVHLILCLTIDGQIPSFNFFVLFLNMWRLLLKLIYRCPLNRRALRLRCERGILGSKFSLPFGSPDNYFLSCICRSPVQPSSSCFCSRRGQGSWRHVSNDSESVPFPTRYPRFSCSLVCSRKQHFSVLKQLTVYPGKM